MFFKKIDFFMLQINLYKSFTLKEKEVILKQITLIHPIFFKVSHHLLAGHS